MAPQGLLPGITQRQNHHVGKEEIVAHGRGQGDGIIGHQSHREGGHGTGHVGGHQSGLQIHPGGAHHHRLHEDDVRKGHEGGYSTGDFSLPGGVVFGQFEEALEHVGCSTHQHKHRPCESGAIVLFAA